MAKDYSPARLTATMLLQSFKEMKAKDKKQPPSEHLIEQINDMLAGARSGAPASIAGHIPRDVPANATWIDLETTLKGVLAALPGPAAKVVPPKRQ